MPTRGLGQLDDAGFPARLDTIPDREATGRARSGLGDNFAHPLVGLGLELAIKASSSRSSWWSG